ncbi:MAG TPA: RNA polymerase sigma factor, partial [Phototrophicaceae bacterium]|nr:RNA polymerase sigma factor [Phototrophicaceae bacterium]
MILQTDEALALGVQRGDKQKLTELVARHHSPLVGYLYRMTGGDRTLAEDLAQETFLRVLRGIQQYQHPRPFKPWLYALATNLARDHYKRAETRRTLPMAESLSQRLEAEEQPEDALLADDETRQVMAALATLPDFQREIVVLRYYQGLSHAEIAETLNIPTGTVKSRLSNGLNRLRELLNTDDAVVD